MRTALSRILLVGLLGLAVAAVVVGTSGGGGGDVSLGDLGPDDLSHQAFALDEPGRFAVDAAGSFEEAGTAASDTTMAAYGWVVRRDDGAVVWRMRARRPDRGTLAAVRDTVALRAGTYDVYFTSLGDPLVRDPGPRDGSLGERIRAALSRGGRSWVGDAGRWRMALHALDAGARRARTSGLEGPARAADGGPAVVWQARGVGDRERRDAVVHVVRDATVRLRTVTEITDGVVADRASVVRLGTRDTVWAASGDGAWAGGSLKNRALDHTLALGPGLYRVAFEADRSHAYDDWTANPPWVPARWGVRVERADSGDAVRVLDPADLDLPTLVAFECVGPDERREATFTVPSPTDVLLVATGEIAYGVAYDVAVVDRLDGDGGWEPEWAMGEGHTEPAGGDDKNRRAVAALSLDPGRYRLTYETDGSHDCVDGYNGGGGPSDPLWGARLYALEPGLGPDAFDVEVAAAPAPPGLGAPGLDAPGGAALLAQIDSVGDDQDRRVRFTLAQPARVEVVAAGEISERERYDWAAITRGGDVVWEMSWDNTSPGESGSLHHRVYRGGLELGAGTYTVRYRTDASLSFGDFGEASRGLWGVRVYGPAAVEDAVPPPAPADVPPPPPAPPPAPTNTI